MNDRRPTTKQIAYRLIQKAKKLTQPGTGLFVTSNQQEIKSEFIKIAVCSVQEVESYIEKHIQICLSIKKEHTESIQKLKAYYSEKLTKILENENVNSIMLDYNTQNFQILLSIIRFFQSKECFIFIRACLSSQNFNQYQIKLSQVNKDLFSQPFVVLQGISLVIDLPLMNQTTLQEYAVTLLSIWDKIIPASLSSLVILDWIDSGHKSTIFSLHFVKNMKIKWSLQFQTEKIQRSEILGCQCIGIN